MEERFSVYTQRTAYMSEDSRDFGALIKIFEELNFGSVCRACGLWTAACFRST